MYRKDIHEAIGSYKHQLAICRYSYDHYYSMTYQVVIRSCDIFDNERLYGYGDGYFIKYESHYDFLSIDEFTQYFTIVDDCGENKRISSLLKWLREEKKIKITIIPDILDDGYWYEYRFWTSYPFYVTNVEEHGFGSFELAAKRAINLAKEACLKTHGIKGIKEWVNYTFNKK